MKSLFAKAGFLIWMAISCICLHVTAQTNVVPNRTDDYKLNAGDTSYSMRKKYIDQIITKKTHLLEKYLTDLVEKKGQTDQTINKAMMLFNNDESKMITVTNKTTGKV